MEGGRGDILTVFVGLPWLIMSTFAAVSCSGEQSDRGVSGAGADHHPLRHSSQSGDRIILIQFRRGRKSSCSNVVLPSLHPPLSNVCFPFSSYCFCRSHCFFLYVFTTIPPFLCSDRDGHHVLLALIARCLFLNVWSGYRNC